MVAARDLFRDSQTSCERNSRRIGNIWCPGSLFSHRPSNWNRKQRMKDFSNASFSPDLIKAMDQALADAVATLPYPVSSLRVQNIAESILRGAKQGEREPRILQTMALLEMQIRSEET
jgi:hypothetical protein